MTFLRNAVRLQTRYANGKTIENALQTNATLLDDAWGEFLSAHRWLVGVSIDGPREMHDAYRVDKGGQPTLDRVMRGIEVLRSHRVAFNTLTTVHRANAQYPLEVYRFLRENGSGMAPRGTKHQVVLQKIHRSSTSPAAPSGILPRRGNKSPGWTEATVLRCVFIGSPNRFTKLLAHWLSKRIHLSGVVWTSSAHWALSLSGRMRFAGKRLNRVGLLKTVDEVLYYVLSKKILNDTGEKFQSRLLDAYIRQYGLPEWEGNAIRTDDINSRDVINFVRECSPDLIMSMCINEFFRREIRETPRLGAFLWHEGIVPEYRGLYSPFWAMYNRQPEMLGYTVLRMNGRYDEGEVFLQGRVSDVDPQTDSPPYIGHKAILDSLAGVARLFEELEKGTAKPIATQGRRGACYTYPGLTDWIRLRMRMRRVSVGVIEDPEVRWSAADKRPSA